MSTAPNAEKYLGTVVFRLDGATPFTGTIHFKGIGADGRINYLIRYQHGTNSFGLNLSSNEPFAVDFTSENSTLKTIGNPAGVPPGLSPVPLSLGRPANTKPRGTGRGRLSDWATMDQEHQEQQRRQQQQRQQQQQDKPYEIYEEAKFETFETKPQWPRQSQPPLPADTVKPFKPKYEMVPCKAPGCERQMPKGASNCGRDCESASVNRRRKCVNCPRSTDRPNMAKCRKCHEASAPKCACGNPRSKMYEKCSKCHQKHDLGIEYKKCVIEGCNNDSVYDYRRGVARSHCTDCYKAAQHPCKNYETCGRMAPGIYDLCLACHHAELRGRRKFGPGEHEPNFSPSPQRKPMKECVCSGYANSSGIRIRCPNPAFAPAGKENNALCVECKQMGPMAFKPQEKDDALSSEERERRARQKAAAASAGAGQKKKK